MVALGLLALAVLATVASGLQVWLSQQPAWALFKASLAGLCSALVLSVVVVGKEFRWWHFDGALLDKVAVPWVAVTLVVAAVTYWLTR